MTPVVWTRAALRDLEEILEYVEERSHQGAISVARRVDRTVETISIFPRTARRDPATGVYETVVRGAPLLIIYEFVGLNDGKSEAQIIAVFLTSRNPASKPGRRDD